APWLCLYLSIATGFDVHSVTCHNRVSDSSYLDPSPDLDSDRVTCHPRHDAADAASARASLNPCPHRQPLSYQTGLPSPPSRKSHQIHQTLFLSQSPLHPRHYRYSRRSPLPPARPLCRRAAWSLRLTTWV